MTGQELTPAEQALLTRIRAQFQSSRAGDPAATGASGGGGGSDVARYIVFTRREGKITAVPIRTGLTDQDYIEVLEGALSEQDTVIVLSSTAQ